MADWREEALMRIAFVFSLIVLIAVIGFIWCVSCISASAGERP